jgi:hypothetical protein
VTSSEAPARREIHPRLVFALFGIALAALPFAAVDYVPATDLPQHVAQVRLLRELWGLAPHSLDLTHLVARPFGANTLCYWPLLAASFVVSPHCAGKLTLLLYVVAAVVALHALAWRRNRPPEHALLAGTLLFSLPLYWGLLNFVCGLAPFLWFCERALRPRQRRISEVAVDAALLTVLYFAHVMWVAAAAAIAASVAVAGIYKRRDVREAALWSACFSPFALASAYWLLGLLEQRASTGMELEARYLTPIVQRLSPRWLAQTLYGGLRGPFEPLMLVGLAGYALLAIIRSRRSERRDFDPALLAIGVGFFVFALLAPDKYLNTILFNERFLFCAAMFALQALPAVRGRALPLLAAVLAVGFGLATTTVWVIFDQDELSGLRASLASIDRPRSVLGLDYRQRSDVVQDRPFLQLFAYAQAERGGELAFSFAEHRSSIVAYAKPRVRNWTEGLEWLPEQARQRDVDAFDCVLVDGSDAQHQAFSTGFGLRSRVTEGYFRLYCHE